MSSRVFLQPAETSPSLCTIIRKIHLDYHRSNCFTKVFITVTRIKIVSPLRERMNKSVNNGGHDSTNGLARSINPFTRERLTLNISGVVVSQSSRNDSGSLGTFPRMFHGFCFLQKSTSGKIIVSVIGGCHRAATSAG